MPRTGYILVDTTLKCGITNTYIHTYKLLSIIHTVWREIIADRKFYESLKKPSEYIFAILIFASAYFDAFHVVQSVHFQSVFLFQLPWTFMATSADRASFSVKAIVRGYHANKDV